MHIGKSVSGALVRSKKCLDREVWGLRILNLRQRGCIIRVLTVKGKGYVNKDEHNEHTKDTHIDPHWSSEFGHRR